MSPLGHRRLFTTARRTTDGEGELLRLLETPQRVLRVEETPPPLPAQCVLVEFAALRTNPYRLVAQTPVGLLLAALDRAPGEVQEGKEGDGA